MSYRLIILVCLVFLLISSAGCNKPLSIRFGVFSDTHIMKGTTARTDLARAVRDANKQSLNFVLVTGDVTDMNIGDNLAVAKEVLDSLNCPYYIIPGNHDTKWSGSGGYNFNLLWDSDKFRFEVGGITFIGIHQGPVLRMADGHISSNDLIWLDKILSKIESYDPIILVTHYPLNSSVDNWYELSDRIKNHNVRFIIHGHGHRNRLINNEGIPAVMVRSTLRGKNDPGGYNLVNVTRDSIFFSEKNYDQDVKSPWCKLSLKSFPEALKPVYEERPDYSINNKYQNVSILWQFETNFTTTAAPEAEDKQAYIGNLNGEMMCLDLQNGQKNWSFNCKGPVFSKAALGSGVVVFSSGDSAIYALDSDSGTLLWKVKTRAPNVAIPVIHGNRVFVGGSDGSFRSLDLHSGKKLWEYSDIGSYIESRPFVYGDKIIFGAWDESIYALYWKNGQLCWQWKEGRPGSLYSPAACWPVAVNNIVYFVAPDRYFTAVDINTGKTIWRTNKHIVRETVGLSANSDLIIARCMRDTVFAVSAGFQKYEERWISDAGYGYDIAPSMPMESEGTLYFGTKNGLIVAMDSKTGTVLWKYKLGNALINTVKPISRSKVLISTMDGIIALLEG